MGCLGEEPKVRKGRGQGALESNKCGKIEGEGDKRGWSGKRRQILEK